MAQFADPTTPATVAYLECVSNALREFDGPDSQAWSMEGFMAKLSEKVDPVWAGLHETRPTDAELLQFLHLKFRGDLNGP